jgi:hypothetical protein
MFVIYRSLLTYLEYRINIDPLVFLLRSSARCPVPRMRSRSIVGEAKDVVLLARDGSMMQGGLCVRNRLAGNHGNNGLHDDHPVISIDGSFHL